VSTTVPRPQSTRPARRTEAPAEVAARPDADALPARLFAAGVAACTVGVALFLSFRLTSWAPHEDETLALFVGRKPFGAMLDTVLGQRGGAPLHFLFAWAIAHLGGGLESLRLVSAVFAVASVPLVAILGARLAGRGPALAATVIVSASWTLLFHGVYGRMYALFLFTSLLANIALLRALERGGRSWWLWTIASVLMIASHAYGALVLAAHGLYVVLARTRVREAAMYGALVLVLGLPMWRSDFVLADRFDVGLGRGGAKLNGPWSVLQYLRQVAADFTAGYRIALAAVIAGAAVGLWQIARTRPRSALFIGCMFSVPVAMFLIGRFGNSTSPETRHLIFAAPLFALCVGAGALSRPGRWQLVGAAAVLALVPLELQWGHSKTPALYDGEPHVRVAARHEASALLARISRPDDVLFGFDPLFLGAWEQGANVSEIVVPRADPKLALDVLRTTPKPLGHALFVFDASDNNNISPRMRIDLQFPGGTGRWEEWTFGPFLILRTLDPTRDVETYLQRARDAQLVGKRLYLGDADVNYDTVWRAQLRLKRSQR
jgi:dolichyl-phosphate-mannose-protein mannosyltransferase